MFVNAINATCPICERQYSSSSIPPKREMLICLNQHYMCQICATQIAEKDSICPFCKKNFDINQIQPKRYEIKQEQLHKDPKPLKEILKKGLCPFDHRIGKFSLTKQICNKCGQIRSARWTCEICHFVLCCNCSNNCKISHQDFCQSSDWIYDQKDLGCNICGKNEKGGRTCQVCQMRICRIHDTEPENFLIKNSKPFGFTAASLIGIYCIYEFFKK